MISSHPWKAVAIGCFGLAVIASGFWRFLSAKGGHTGLWFGIVMGSVAFGAGILFVRQQNVVANIVAWLCLALVGGWFFYEALIKKGWAQAEVRQLIIIGVALLTAVVFVLAKGKPDSQSA